jgi:thiamine biosynthesis lipoprotein
MLAFAPMRRRIAFAGPLALVLAAACHDATPRPEPEAPASQPTPAAPPPSTPAPPVAPIASAPTPGERVTADGHAMGTHLAFAAFTTPTLDAATIHAAFDAAIAEIQRVEALMTTWRDDSEVSKINTAAGKSPVVVSDETYRVIADAVHTSEISEGTFDITFESLHGLWKFDEDLDPHPPTAAQVRARLPLVGYKHIKLDAAAKSVFLDKVGVRIGLGGIAKGYAVDRAADVLRAKGLTAFYAQAGGDLYTAGLKPDGAEWNAGIRDPRGPEGDAFVLLPISDRAFSTAGDYERSYVIDGKRYHHIIDPRTGFPATASRSVTIWAKSALVADELDDAVFILGPVKGLALVESVPDVGAVIVDAKNVVHVSKRLDGKLKFIHPPVDAP